MLWSYLGSVSLNLPALYFAQRYTSTHKTRTSDRINAKKKKKKKNEFRRDFVSILRFVPQEQEEQRLEIIVHVEDDIVVQKSSRCRPRFRFGRRCRSRGASGEDQGHRRERNVRERVHFGRHSISGGSSRNRVQVFVGENPNRANGRRREPNQ